MTTMTAKQQARQESIEWLRKRLKPGDTIHCVLESRARSGMSRTINFYVSDGDGGMTYLTGHIAYALGMTRTYQGALRVGGCGMDMGFHVVYNLGAAIFGHGDKSTFACIGDQCPSNEHSNRVKPPAGSCAGDGCNDLTCKPWYHSDGGYALRHNWL